MAQSAIQQRLELRKQCANHEEYVQKRDEKQAAEKNDEIQQLLIETLKQTDIPENNFWDEIEKTYQTAFNLTVSATEELANALAQFKDNPALADTCTDYPRLVKLVNQVSRDTEIYLNELESIHATHEGKTGAVTNADDLLICDHAQNNYKERMEIFHTITNPNVIEIHQLIGTIDKAIDELKERHALMKQGTGVEAVEEVAQPVVD